MSVPAPDPRAVREANLEELRRLRLPLPPDTFPLVWEPGDHIELRTTAELQARLAILHVVLARCFGMHPQSAMSWLLNSHLTDAVTPPELQFVVGSRGDHRSFVLHHDAAFALAWVLGLADYLDPRSPSDDKLMSKLPDLPAGETFEQWCARSPATPRGEMETAAMLDFHYCLDWSYLEAERIGAPLPGVVDSNAIGQRRWALEWVVIFRGPYHDPPAGWEEVDLST